MVLWELNVALLQIFFNLNITLVIREVYRLAKFHHIILQTKDLSLKKTLG